jgi:glutaredoxin 2
MVKYFEKKVETGRGHFSTLFKEPTGYNITEIMKILNMFPSVINDEMNQALEAYVTSEEVFSVLSSFKKGGVRWFIG